MRILMFGWEFPPHNSGGLGIACRGLARALSEEGHDVTFVLPKQIDVEADYMDIVFADIPTETETQVEHMFHGYITQSEYQKKRDALPEDVAKMYGKSLYAETQAYARKAKHLASIIDHDVIHVHDWLSMPAGMAAKHVSKKPLVTHVHATEFDRTANGDVNQTVYETERAGMHAADKVLAVSDFTKQKVQKHYAVTEHKIRVVYNGMESDMIDDLPGSPLQNHKRLVLFLGRLTIQKGPDYFLQSAKRILETRQDTLFVVTGSGDMEERLIEQAAEMGIGEHIIFTGFCRGERVDRLYQMADVYVMPSVSEPFGLTALESIQNGTPVVISKQSGVSEVIPNATRVDFWDTDKLADEIDRLLTTDQQTRNAVAREQKRHADRFTWKKAARTCSDIYRQLITSGRTVT
jgi:glycosyltransferase involved in cell wall biosynthesis